MRFRPGRYFWKLFLANAVVMAVVVAGCVWVLMAQLDRFRQEEVSRSLRAQADALNAAAGDRLDRSYAGELQWLAKKVAASESKGVRVTFVLADGTVLADSEAYPQRMESHRDRPEIQEAMAIGVGQSVRWSHTVSRTMRYVAVRVGTPPHTKGVVRVAMARESMMARAQPGRRVVILIATLAVVAAVVMALALAALWSRRLQRITQVARTISRGDLSATVPTAGFDEVATLGRSLNRMRERIAAQLGAIDRQRRTLDGLVAQLREGVVVANAGGRIVLINAEAIDLLQLGMSRDHAAFVGRTIEQCVPQPRLQRLLLVGPPASPTERTGKDAASPRRASSQEIELRLERGDGPRTVLARAFDVTLPDEESPEGTSERVARAMILTDITELSRVMQVKADLAANASHELRTPLSAIRAAIDTLGSLDLTADPPDLGPLLAVIDRHSARMEAMIGDLLELSRLESGANQFPARAVSVRALLEELHTEVAEMISRKRLHWASKVEEGVAIVQCSPELLRMVLRNLIANAVRFTDNEGSVTVTVADAGDKAVFRVTDTGCGIAPVDQRRIFERFYQVQRARGGGERGTGLGLSIVRHAAAALDAQVELASEPGRGTAVTVSVPMGDRGDVPS